MYTSSQPRVPEGLRDMMKNFTKTILKEKPHDIYEFSEQYFQHKLQEKNDYVVKDFEPIKTQYDFSYTLHQSQTQHHTMPLSLAHSIVPSVISELMKGFIKSVLKEQPHNLCEFGVAYFRQLRATYCVQHEISYEAYDNYLSRRAQFPGTPYIKCTCGRILANGFAIESKRETTDSRENMASQISSIQNSTINRENIKIVVQNYSEPHFKAICTIQRYIRMYLKKKTLANQQQLSKPGMSIECAVLIIQKWIRQVLKKRSGTEAPAEQHTQLINDDNSELETSYTSASTAILSAESALDSSEKRMQATLNNIEDYKIDHLTIEKSHKEAIETFEDTLEKSETNPLNKQENTNQIVLIPKKEILELDSNEQSINLDQTNNTPEICGEKKIQFHTKAEDQINNNEDVVNASFEISREKGISEILTEESTVLTSESNLNKNEPVNGIQKEKETNQNLKEECNDIKLQINGEQCLENFEKETTLNESSSNKEDEINPDALHINKEILVEDRNLKKHSLKAEEESLVEGTTDIINDNNGTSNMNSNNSRIVLNNADTEPTSGDKFQIENSSGQDETKLIKFNKSDSKEVSGLKTEDHFQKDMLQTNEWYGKDENCEGTQKNIQHFELSNNSNNDIRSFENILDQKGFKTDIRSLEVDAEVIEKSKYNKRINKTDDINKEEIKESHFGDKDHNDESNTIQNDGINREDGCDLKNNLTDDTNSDKEDIMKKSKGKGSNESEILDESTGNISINIEEQRVNQPLNEDNCSNKTEANNEELKHINEEKEFENTLETIFNDEEIIIDMSKNVHKQEIFEEVATTEEKFTNSKVLESREKQIVEITNEETENFAQVIKQGIFDEVTTAEEMFTNSKAYETNEKQIGKTINEVNEENSVQMVKQEEIVTSDERILQKEIITTQENLNTITSESEMMHLIEELNASDNIAARKKTLNQIDREMETSSSSSLNPEEYLDLNSDTFDERIPYEPINDNMTNKVITDNPNSEGTHINGSSREDELPRPLNKENQSFTNLQTIQNSDVVSEPASSEEYKNEEFLGYNKSQNIELSYENDKENINIETKIEMLDNQNSSTLRDNTESVDKSETGSIVVPSINKKENDTITPNTIKMDESIIVDELKIKNMVTQAENSEVLNNVLNTNNVLENLTQTTDVNNLKEDLINTLETDELPIKSSVDPEESNKTETLVSEPVTLDESFDVIGTDKENDNQDEKMKDDKEETDISIAETEILIEKISDEDVRKNKEVNYIKKDDKQEHTSLNDSSDLPSQTSAETGILIKKTADKDVRKDKQLNSVDEDHKKDKNVSLFTDTSKLHSEISVETIISISSDTIREQNEKISTNYIYNVENIKENEIDNDVPMANSTKDSIEIPSDSLTTNTHSTPDTSEYHRDDAAVHTVDNIRQSSIQSEVKAMENTSDIINKETEKSNDETKNVSEIENITSQNCNEGPLKGTESHEMDNKLANSFDKSCLKREETTENSIENVESNISSKNETSVYGNEEKMPIEYGKSSAISKAQESKQSKSIEEDTIEAAENLETNENSQVMSVKEDTTRKLTELMNVNKAGQAVVETTKLKASNFIDDTNNSNESYKEERTEETNNSVIDSVVSQELIAASEACENQSLPVKIEAKEINLNNDIISVAITDPIVSHERGLTVDKDIESYRSMRTQLKINNDFKTVLSEFLNSERMHSYTVSRKGSFPKYDLQDITEVVNEFMGTITNINEEPPCIKKTLKLTLINDDDNNREMHDGSSQQRRDSVENITDDDSLSKKTEKMQQPDSIIEKMKQRQESTSRIQTNGMAKIRDVNFEEPTVKSIDTSPDTDEDKIIIKNMPQHQESTESSHNSDDVVYGNGGGCQNEVKTLETRSTGKESVQLQKKETDKSNKALKPIIKSVTIDDSIHYIERSQFNDSFVMDDDTTEDIRRKIMAYSISDTDSDYIEKTMMESDGDRAEDEPLLNYDHFNISTAIMDNGNTSTETESTIVSAVTKIQAGTRGYLTRKRLGRTSVTSGTKSSVKGDSKASFGNAAFSESIEHLVQEAAAKLIQNAYRKHYKARQSRINTQRNGKTSGELAGKRNLLAQRRLTLQRGDALRYDSTPDEPTSSSSSGGDEKLTEANKFVNTKKQTVITSPERQGRRAYGTKLNWTSIRQNSMPVQIDSEVFRVIPKRLRKRIQSAENDGKKTTSRSTKN